jgi:hypothetical protein
VRLAAMWHTTVYGIVPSTVLRFYVDQHLGALDSHLLKIAEQDIMRADNELDANLQPA